MLSETRPRNLGWRGRFGEAGPQLSLRERAAPPCVHFILSARVSLRRCVAQQTAAILDFFPLSPPPSSLSVCVCVCICVLFDKNFEILKKWWLSYTTQLCGLLTRIKLDYLWIYILDFGERATVLLVGVCVCDTRIRARPSCLFHEHTVLHTAFLTL